MITDIIAEDLAAVAGSVVKANTLAAGEIEGILADLAPGGPNVERKELRRRLQRVYLGLTGKRLWSDRVAPIAASVAALHDLSRQSAPEVEHEQ